MKRGPALAASAALAAALAAALFPMAARAHVAEGALILLLPTEVYTAAGVWVVALTVAALAFAPAGWLRLGAVALPRPPATQAMSAARVAVSLCAAVFLLALCWIGLTGARDPLANPLPLTIWTVWWVALVLAQGVFGDLWRWLNPWTGPAALIGGRGRLPLPRRLGPWPAAALLTVFALFALADPAPDDPARLARIVFLYWAVTLLGVALFGPPWLARVEFVTALMRLVADMAPVRRGRLGAPGWRLGRRPASAAAALLALAFLGVGSFDGLNETFWWLGLIGVNPLEFPGRSALIAETSLGLIGLLVLLLGAFGACVWLGLRLAGGGVSWRRACLRLAPTALPIAFAYHFAHYLVVLMVNGQYALAAATDPMATGADWLGVGVFYVTTGFLNATDSVETIFQAQAGAVVAGHVLSVILAHGVAIRLFGSRRRAALSQIPLAAFMIGYTFLGLWLLAAPKGA